MIQHGNRERGGAAGPERGPREPQRHRDGGGLRGMRLGGSLSGGLGVAIVAASTALGASATMLLGKEPGSILGVFVIIGTVAAGVAVRPQSGRVIIPVPALSYLIAAMVTGVIYDHSADTSKTALAIDAAQWIANGFFAMALATILVAALVIGRWILWRRQQPVSRAPGRSSSARPLADHDGLAANLDDYWSPAPYGSAPSRAQGPRGGTLRPDQQWPRPDPRQARSQGPDPYNFSSGA